MLITKYIYKRKYVYLYLENGEVHKIYISVFEKNYKKISSVSFGKSDLDELLYQNEIFRAKDRVLSYLTTRSKSKKEVILYLRRKNFSDKIIKEIVDYCEKMNFINEKDFIEKYSKELIGKRKGPYFVGKKLMEKGIFMKNLDEYLVRIYSKEKIYDNILYLIKKKMKSLKKNEINVAKGKILNYLLRLGYAFDDIKKVMKDFFEKL